MFARTTSPEISTAAVLLGLVSNLVASDQKEPNRSERAIQTGKNHIIATRAGFHRDRPHTLLDKCLAAPDGAGPYVIIYK
jgi:hypothetical protein